MATNFMKNKVSENTLGSSVKFKGLHLVHSPGPPHQKRKKFLLKTNFSTYSKTNFSHLNNFFYTFSKKFHTLAQKEQIFQTKIMSCNYWKKSKEFLILVWENFLYFWEKVKALHFRCILNTAMLFFISAKHNRVFNKLRVLTFAESFTWFIFVSRRITLSCPRWIWATYIWYNEPKPYH